MPDPPFHQGVNNPRYHDEVITRTKHAIDQASDFGSVSYTHLMALLSKAASRARRLDVIVELMRAMAGTGLYADGREELCLLYTSRCV